MEECKTLSVQLINELETPVYLDVLNEHVDIEQILRALGFLVPSVAVPERIVTNRCRSAHFLPIPIDGAQNAYLEGSDQITRYPTTGVRTCRQAIHVPQADSSEEVGVDNVPSCINYLP